MRSNCKIHSITKTCIRAGILMLFYSIAITPARAVIISYTSNPQIWTGSLTVTCESGVTGYVSGNLYHSGGSCYTNAFGISVCSSYAHYEPLTTAAWYYIDGVLTEGQYAKDGSIRMSLPSRVYDSRPHLVEMFMNATGSSFYDAQKLTPVTITCAPIQKYKCDPISTRKIQIGGTQWIQVKVRNTGTTTWEPNRHYLAIDYVSDSKLTAPWITVSAPVTPGTVAVLYVPIYAPNTPGIQYLNLRMLDIQKGWFTDNQSCSTYIEVVVHLPPPSS